MSTSNPINRVSRLNANSSSEGSFYVRPQISNSSPTGNLAGAEGLGASFTFLGTDFYQLSSAGTALYKNGSAIALANWEVEMQFIASFNGMVYLMSGAEHGHHLYAFSPDQTAPQLVLDWGGKPTPIHFKACTLGIGVVDAENGFHFYNGEGEWVSTTISAVGEAGLEITALALGATPGLQTELQVYVAYQGKVGYVDVQTGAITMLFDQDEKWNGIYDMAKLSVTSDQYTSEYLYFNTVSGGRIYACYLDCDCELVKLSGQSTRSEEQNSEIRIDASGKICFYNHPHQRLKYVNPTFFKHYVQFISGGTPLVLPNHSLEIKGQDDPNTTRLEFYAADYSYLGEIELTWVEAEGTPEGVPDFYIEVNGADPVEPIYSAHIQGSPQSLELDLTTNALGGVVIIGEMDIRPGHFAPVRDRQ